MIEPELPRMASEILAAIAAEVPEYARPLEGSFGRGIETGVTEALSQFLALIRDPDAGRGTGREVYVELGRGELRQGRTLDSLQAAYRVGARVAWRHAAAAGRAHGLDPEVLSLLAESMFAYIDELSADSVEGYAAAQSEREGERQRRRRELANMVLGNTLPGGEELRALANEAGWQLPRSVAPVACAEGELGAVAVRLGGEVVATARDGYGCLLFPDPEGPGRRAALARVAEATDAALALGPTLGLTSGDARAVGEPSASLAGPAATGAPAGAAAGGAAFTGARAWALTCAALRLTAAAAGRLLAVDEHLGELALRESQDLMRRLLELQLAPLIPLSEGARRRLSQTLLSYIDRSGNAVAIAEDLGIHPQTARHRIARLRELFGEDLDRPGWRFETALALRAAKVAPAGT